MVKRKTNPIDKMCWNMNIPQPKPSGMKGVKVISDAEFNRIRSKELAFGDMERGCGCTAKKKPARIGRFGNKAEERKARVRLNKKLNHISERYYANNIPWGIIMDAAISEGFEGAMLTNIDDNRPGKVHVNIGGDTWLTVMWYIMPESQKYEITAYVN